MAGKVAALVLTVIAGLVASAVAASSAFAATLSNGDGVLIYAADPGEANDIEISTAGGHIIFTESGHVAATGDPIVVTAGGPGCASTAPDTVSCDSAVVHAIQVTTGDEDDTITFQNQLPVNRLSGDGGSGNDYLYGGDGNETLIGGTGQDNITGSGGDDRIDGGDQNDSLEGGPGHDIINGGAGDDTLYANDGENDDARCGLGIDAVDADTSDAVGQDCETDLNGDGLNQPFATTEAATDVTSSSATLRGSVNPRGTGTTYRFEWGTTTNYGSSTAGSSAGSGNSAVPVSAPINGLTGATTYHFRVVATNELGTRAGGDMTFTTAPTDTDGDGTPDNADCGPTDPSVHPGAADQPDLAFVDSNCDGIDGDAANAVFVSSSGNDAALGTKEQPVFSLEAGVLRAQQRGVHSLYLSKVIFHAQGAGFSPPPGFGIYGGYDSATWQRNLVTSATPTHTTIAGSPEAVLLDGTTGVTFQLLQLAGSTGDQSDAPTSRSAYGLRAVNGSQVVLQDVTVLAYDGQPGADGARGHYGAAGPSGHDGGDGTLDVDAVALWGGSEWEGSGGDEGACCLPTSGGHGGAGGWGPSYSLGYGQSGENGGGPHGGAGGTGGEENDPGKPGTDGAPGGNGDAGGAGAARTVPGAPAQGAEWSGASGTAGANGTPGSGGGGGGGGGGQNCELFCDPGNGDGAGGGGNGGEPGLGGGAGQPGGASIGVWLRNSSITATAGSVIQSSHGGAGGAGGDGGSGGNGGNGGHGSHYGVSEIGAGGNGGPGGGGGHGGPGGGGSGGPSLAIFNAGTSSSATLSTDTVLTNGASGAGGPSPAGGAANGAPGAAGGCAGTCTTLAILPTLASYAVVRGPHAVVTLRCPTGCTYDASLTAASRARRASIAKATALGHAKGSARAGQVKSVTIRLTAAGRRLVAKRGSLAARLAVTVRMAGQAPVTTTKSVDLVRPRPAKSLSAAKVARAVKTTLAAVTKALGRLTPSQIVAKRGLSVRATVPGTATVSALVTAMRDGRPVMFAGGHSFAPGPGKPALRVKLGTGAASLASTAKRLTLIVTVAMEPVAGRAGHATATVATASG